MKNGFADYIPRYVIGPHDRMQKFFNQVDLRKGPIERTVRTIVRLKAIDWNTTKHEHKEFIYYTEDWAANNWLGIPITKWCSSDHVEGRYTEVVMRPVLDEKTGEHIDNAFAGAREVYYIPFSKKNVDEIRANSTHSDKSNIRFVVKFGLEDSQEAMAMSTHNQFSYDMFLWPWEKLCEFQYWPLDDLTET